MRSARRLDAWRSGVILLLISAIWIVPLIWAIGTSLRAPDQPLGDGWLWMPGLPTLANYREAWSDAPFLTYYINTIIIVSGTLAVQLVTITLSGYAFARVQFPGREIFFGLFIIQLLTPITVLVVPNFVTMKDLHLVDHKRGDHAALYGVGVRHLPDAAGLPHSAAGTGRGSARRWRPAGGRCCATSTCHRRAPRWWPSRSSRSPSTGTISSGRCS